MSKWSKELTRKFIKEYEKQPCLWDRNHPQYRKLLFNKKCTILNSKMCFRE